MTLLASWLTLQLLLVVVWASAVLFERAPVGRRAALRTARGLLALAVVAPFVLSPTFADSAWRPDPQAFTETLASGATALHLGTASTPVVVPADVPAAAFLVLAVAVALTALLAVASGLHLRRALRATSPWRRVGSVELRVGDRSFAAWRPGRRYVVIEQGLVARPADLRLALAHELQHHRHGDPVVAWLLLALRVVCAPNPFAHALARRFAALEELACDEAVLARPHVTPRAYGGCLLRAAAATPLPLAAGLHHPSLLRRRILMLTPRRRVPALPLSLVCAAAVATTAWLASGLVAPAVAANPGSAHVDERPDPAVALAIAAVSDATFTVPDHPQVHRALARIQDRPKTAAYFAQGMNRRAAWSSLVDGALADAGLPPQLAAVPLVESGYENLGEYADGLSAAPGIPGKGLWMFIPQTARRYGLAVDATTDDRLDPVKETDAAVRLLTDLHDEFGDWGLALAGYNQGAAHVRTAIETEGTRDGMELAARGALNHYVPMVYAAALLLEDPELLDR